LSRPHERQIRTALLGIDSERTHLNHDVGLLKNLGARGYSCASSHILIVWKTRAGARRVFDHDARTQLS
jgi:hypothetical protein